MVSEVNASPVPRSTSSRADNTILRCSTWGSGAICTARRTSTRCSRGEDGRRGDLSSCSTLVEARSARGIVEVGGNSGRASSTPRHARLAFAARESGGTGIRSRLRICRPKGLGVRVPSHSWPTPLDTTGEQGWSSEGAGSVLGVTALPRADVRLRLRMTPETGPESSTVFLPTSRPPPESGESLGAMAGMRWQHWHIADQLAATNLCCVGRPAYALRFARRGGRGRSGGRLCAGTAEGERSGRQEKLSHREEVRVKSGDALSVCVPLHRTNVRAPPQYLGTSVTTSIQCDVSRIPMWRLVAGRPGRSSPVSN